MVVIRLARGGANKRPFYKVVVANSRAPRDGGYLEQLGYFNPIAVGGEKRLELKSERVTHWLSQGAKPSLRVAQLLRELKNSELVTQHSEPKAAHKVGEHSQAEDATVEAEAPTTA